MSVWNAVKERIAASSTFQTWTGSADADAAEQRVHLGEYSGERFPFATVDMPQSEFEVNSGAFPHGSVEVTFKGYCDAADRFDVSGAAQAMVDRIETICGELQAQTGGLLLVRGARPVDEPLFHHRQDTRSYMTMTVSIDYGATP